MKSGRQHTVLWIIATVVLFCLPLVIQNRYQIRLIDIICINILLSVGLNIVKGFCGQVTVGHIGLYAIGAYSSALLALEFGWPFWLSFPAAIIICAAAGLIIGIPSFRLEGAYLALVTLGFGETVRIAISVTDAFGATYGLSRIPPPVIGDFAFKTPWEYYYLAMPVMLIGVLFSFRLLRSGIGRAFKAVRDDALAAAATGINVRKCKLLAFMISAIYAGAAGSLYAHLNPGYIHPNNFTIIEMITLLLMVVLGGIGHIWGGIIGAIIITIFYELTADYYQYQLLIFGSMIVLVVLFMPKGIGGLIDRHLAIRRFMTLRSGT